MGKYPSILILIACIFAIPTFAQTPASPLIFRSPEFEENKLIPIQYTCEGPNISPPLIIENVPKGTKTFAIIVDDPDAPSGTWVHWVVYNIDPTYLIFQNTNPGTEGFNDFGEQKYGGPCPPDGTHRYFFKLYALDTALELRGKVTKPSLEKAMAGHILSQAQYVGLYKKTGIPWGQ